VCQGSNVRLDMLDLPRFQTMPAAMPQVAAVCMLALDGRLRAPLSMPITTVSTGATTATPADMAGMSCCRTVPSVHLQVAAVKDMHGLPSCSKLVVHPAPSMEDRPLHGCWSLQRSWAPVSSLHCGCTAARNSHAPLLQTAMLVVSSFTVRRQAG
jgi:hypothetical protein